MKLSNFVAAYLAKFSDHAFVVQGGAALHLIDSIERNRDIINVAMQHEQAAAMAADSYSKVDSRVGVTIATSGPGATNLLTGIACSYFDSIPTIHITGNVASFRQSDKYGVRQYGFQETDIVSMARPITKFAKQIISPENILEVLPAAVATALSGRKGPVLIDIPDDFQREALDTDKCHALINHPVNYEFEELSICQDELTIIVDELSSLLDSSQRPVFVFGAGLGNEKLKQRYVKIARKLNIPFLITWPNKGIDDDANSFNLGTFGTHSSRGNNIVLQNADLILSVGSRLDTRATAKLDLFARQAKVVMVDIDSAEMDKFDSLGYEIALKVPCSAEYFFKDILNVNEIQEKQYEYPAWHAYIKKIRGKYNRLPLYKLPLVNPYEAVRQTSSVKHAAHITCVDTGTCLPLALVYGEQHRGQKYISSYNNTPMGYGLPAAIGAALLSQGKRVHCMVGDGGLQMNIQELATLSKLDLNVIIFIFNNNGHAMIRQTQDDWLDSNYIASSVQYGLPEIDFTAIAKGYGIESYRVTSNGEIEKLLSRHNGLTSPLLIEMIIHENFRYEPLIKYGQPLEYMSPTSLNSQIEKDMIIPPHKTNI